VVQREEFVSTDTGRSSRQSGKRSAQQGRVSLGDDVVLGHVGKKVLGLVVDVSCEENLVDGRQRLRALAEDLEILDFEVRDADLRRSLKVSGASLR
jgi:hypothetical protein